MGHKEPGKQLNESDLIAHYFVPLSDPDTAFGLKDDAACLSVPADHDLVISKDMLVADIHFFSDDPADLIARKALRVNLSDLAAKGAEPVGYLLGLGLPTGWSEEWLSCFCQGLEKDQHQFGLALLGGDTVKSPERLTLSVSIFGYVPKGRKVIRPQARAGDALCVSGTIGDAALGLLAHDRGAANLPDDLDTHHRDWLKQRYLLPQPRLTLRQALLDHASAAMDISDGLLGDAQKLANASGMGLQIALEKVPLSPAAQAALEANPSLISVILSGGDDYELLYTIPQDRLAAFKAQSEKLGLPLTQIGRVTGDKVVKVLDANGNAWQQDGPLSFEHF